MTLVVDITLAMLAAGGLLCIARLVRGNSVPDRAVALDTMLVTVVSSVAVGSTRNGSGTYLDLLIVASLLAFVGTGLVARFVEDMGTDS